MTAPDSPRSRWSRLLLLGKLLVSQASEQYGLAMRLEDGADEAAVRRFQERAAHDLSQAIARLRGLPTKLAGTPRLLASLVPERLREPFLHAFGELARDGAELPFREVEGIIREDLGAPSRERFAELEEPPASFGAFSQVHRGKLADGRRIALKVVSPLAREVAEADLGLLRLALHSARCWWPEVDAGAVITDLEARWEEELDAGCEMCHYEEVAGLMGEELRLAEVLPELCGERLLTTTWLTGRRPQRVTGLGETVRGRAARGLTRLLFKPMLTGGLLLPDLKADDVRIDDGGRIGLCDLGCIQRYDAAAPEALRRLLRALRSRPLNEGDEKEIDALLGWPEGLSEVERQGWRAGLSVVLAPFVADAPRRFDEAALEGAGEALLGAASASLPALWRRGPRIPQRPGALALLRGLAGLWDCLAAFDAELLPGALDDLIEGGD